jgi:hypothetical protein
MDPLTWQAAGMFARAIVGFLGGVRATIFCLLFLLMLAGAKFWQHKAQDTQAAFDAYRAKVMAATAKAAEDAHKAEKAEREAFAAIAVQHEKEKADADAKARKLAADLRAGRERLRQHWTCPPGEAGATGGAPGADEDARLREESAGRIVGAAAEADAWIRALQDILRAERSTPP